jgi:hypothetical protein
MFEFDPYDRGRQPVADKSHPTDLPVGASRVTKRRSALGEVENPQPLSLPALPP